VRYSPYCFISFFFRTLKGLAGKVWAVDILWVEDVAQLVKAEAIELCVVCIQFCPQQSPPLLVPLERRAFITHILSEGVHIVRRVNKFEHARIIFGIRPYNIALFGNHQKKEAIDEPEELPVIINGIEPAFPYLLPEILVIGMKDKPVAEYHKRIFNSVPQMLPPPAVRLYAELTVLLKDAFMSGLHIPRPSAPVDYPVEDLELGEELALHNLLKIKLQIGGPAQPSWITEYPELKAVGYDAPEMFCPVEIILYKGMGGDAWPSSGQSRLSRLFRAPSIWIGRPSTPSPRGWDMK
jgi:hypothetical protein